MADFVVSQVKVLAVGLLQPLHELAQRVGGTFQEQMDMVGHQTVGVNGVAITPPVAGQTLEVGLVILITEKSLSPLIAPDNDVIEKPGGKHSGPSGHGGSL